MLDLDAEGEHTVKVHYDGVRKRITVEHEGRPALSSYLDLSKSVTNAEGEAWIGITASTSTGSSEDYVSDLRINKFSFGRVVSLAHS